MSPRTTSTKVALPLRGRRWAFFAADLFSSDCNARIDFQQHGGRDRRHDRCPIDGSNPEPGFWPGHYQQKIGETISDHSDDWASSLIKNCWHGVTRALCYCKPGRLANKQQINSMAYRQQPVPTSDLLTAID